MRYYRLTTENFFFQFSDEKRFSKIKSTGKTADRRNSETCCIKAIRPSFIKCPSKVNGQIGSKHNDISDRFVELSCHVNWNRRNFVNAFQFILTVLFFGGALGFWGVSNTFCSESGDLSPEAVRSSISGGIAFLEEKQQKDGSWIEFPGYDPGTTALVALALLNAGVDRTTPVLVKALEYLRQPLPESRYQTYPISLQTMVLCLAEPEKDRTIIEQNVQWLIARQFKTQNIFRGGWSYVGLHQEYAQVDNSNSQFAVLALYEAERIGIKVPDHVWSEALEYWLRMQNKDGSWGYRASLLGVQRNTSGTGTGSMTCAGITSLVICSGIRGAGGANAEGNNIRCCQQIDNKVTERIDQGLEWLSKHFAIEINPGTPVGVETNLFYYLYGLERVGRLTAHRFIGRSDWYREGADFLLRRKGPFNKYWKAQLDLKNNNAVSTAFALLFLSKGRRPVLISKYKYGSESNWNAHPNDLLHLTQHTEKVWKLDLIWQVIDSEKAVVDDLLQTPVLYICGNDSPVPSDETVKRKMITSLRGYIEQGGFIVAEALDQDRGFDSGFRDLMREIIPPEEGDFRLLESDHPIWNAEQPVPPDQLRPIYGIDFGCRTSVLLIPAWKPEPNGNNSVADVQPSLSCIWESAPEKEWQRAKISETLQKRIEAGIGIGINILAYATNREMKNKEEIPESFTKDLAKKENKYGTVYAAILDYNGGCSCAPRAIPNLMKTLKNELGIPVQNYVRRIKADSKDLYETPVLFMHGRNIFHFSPTEQKNLTVYFNRGGFLFANAICASENFKNSFKDEIRKIFPGSELVPIPSDDPIFSNIYGGFEIKEIEIRKREKIEGRKAGISVIKSKPELWGIKKDDRWIVVFSPHDVSCALEKTGAPECAGYSRSSAFQIAVNVFLYAVEHL